MGALGDVCPNHGAKLSATSVWNLSGVGESARRDLGEVWAQKGEGGGLFAWD